MRNFKCQWRPPRLVCWFPPSGYVLPGCPPVAWWGEGFDCLQSVLWETLYCTWIRHWGPPSSGRLGKRSGRFEREGSQNFNGKWSNWLPVEIFFSRHPNAPLRPKIPHRNSLKKCSLSEKVMKEGERVPFHCGHFATSTDLKELIMQFWQLVTSNFK